VPTEVGFYSSLGYDGDEEDFQGEQSIERNLTYEIYDRDTGKNILVLEVDYVVVKYSEYLPSFNTGPLFISLTLANVFIMAIARKSRRTNI